MFVVSNEKKRLAELDDDVLLSLINEGSLRPKNKKLRILQVLFKDELTDDGNIESKKVWLNGLKEQF